jgi:hypothetical protein
MRLAVVRSWISDHVGVGTEATCVVGEEKLWAARCWEGVDDGIEAVRRRFNPFSFVDFSSNVNVSVLIDGRRKKLVCSLTCESGDPTTSTYYVSGF